MSEPRIIGIAGYARSGKDTVASLLVDKFGWTIVSFADAVRDALYRLNPIVSLIADGYRVRLRDCVDYDGWEAAKEIPEVRNLLQRMGTEVGRDYFGANFWVDLVMDKIDRDPDLRTVIPSVRFRNEARAIKDRGGIVIRVGRPGFGPVNYHPSEIEMDDWIYDWTIFNFGSLADLETAVLEMYDHFFAGHSVT